MIRLTTPDDAIALIALAEATELFDPSQLEQLSEMLADYFDSNSKSDGYADLTVRFWITDNDDEPVGVAYCEIEPMTNQTWNLQLIAIRPDRQRQGRGTLLLRYIEQMLTAKGGRVLLVETSGLPDFERTRAFYRKSGYNEEARIRDFYEVGDDKIVYRKVLAASAN